MKALEGIMCNDLTVTWNDLPFLSVSSETEWHNWYCTGFKLKNQVYLLIDSYGKQLLSTNYNGFTILKQAESNNFAENISFRYDIVKQNWSQGPTIPYKLQRPTVITDFDESNALLIHENGGKKFEVVLYNEREGFRQWFFGRNK